MKQGVALEGSTSTSQQDLHSYTQQTAPTTQPPPQTPQSTGHYIYQQPHSPVTSQSPVSMPEYCSSQDNCYVYFTSLLISPNFVHFIFFFTVFYVFFKLEISRGFPAKDGAKIQTTVVFSNSFSKFFFV